MGIQDVHRTAGRKGFVMTDDVRRAEVAARTFARHAQRVAWEPAYRGLWVSPSGLDARQKVHAAVAVSGGDALVTGRSALFLAGVTDRAPADVELVVPATRRIAHKEGICLHRTTTFEQIRYQHRSSLRTAAVARCFADAAAHDGVNRLCCDIATAVRLRCCTLAGIAAELQLRERFPGSGRLRRAHGLLTGELTHSAGERLGRRLLRAAALHPHRCPLTIEIRGRLAVEIDIAFPKILYGVEVDGPHHLLPHVAAADRTRDRRLEREGWIVDRFFRFEVEERGEWFVGEVTRRVRQLEAGRGR